MSSLPSNPSESTKRRNSQLYPQAAVLAPEPESPPNLASTDEHKLNKTERDFLTHLRVLRDTWVGIQNITLKLADDCRYTPDFWEVLPNGKLVAYEVKGFMRDDARVKLRVAARMFPWIDFILVRRGPSPLVPWLMEKVNS